MLQDGAQLPANNRTHVRNGRAYASLASAAPLHRVLEKRAHRRRQSIRILHVGGQAASLAREFSPSDRGRCKPRRARARSSR